MSTERRETTEPRERQFYRKFMMRPAPYENELCAEQARASIDAAVRQSEAFKAAAERYALAISRMRGLV